MLSRGPTFVSWGVVCRHVADAGPPHVPSHPARMPQASRGLPPSTALRRQLYLHLGSVQLQAPTMRPLLLSSDHLQHYLLLLNAGVGALRTLKPVRAVLQ